MKLLLFDQNFPGDLKIPIHLAGWQSSGKTHGNIVVFMFRTIVYPLIGNPMMKKFYAALKMRLE